MAEREKGKRRSGAGVARWYAAAAAVVVVGVAGIAYASNRGVSGAALGPVPIEGIDDTERLVELAQGETKGNPDASVQIVEFGDYQCPGCGAFATQVKLQLELAYVESGRVQFVFYDYPLIGVHPHAFVAARAARCAADQDGFWPYHDHLYQNQPRWSALTNPVGTFVDYAAGLGLDEDVFEGCLRSDAHAELVTANLRLAEQLGVNQTPTILINIGGSAQRVPPDFGSISALLDAALAEGRGGAE